MIRRFAIFFVLMLVVFLGTVQKAGQAAVSPDILQGTGYPLETPVDTPDPYGPPPTDIPPTPYGGPSGPTPTSRTPVKTATRSTPLTPTSSPRPGSTKIVTTSPARTASATPGPSPTAGRDLFGTEDAEISNSRITPPPSETPAPSPTSTLTPSATAIPAAPSGFLFNPYWFLGGLVVSLTACLGAWLLIRARRSGEFG